MKILIVDDVARARQGIAALVRTHPAVGELKEATNGLEAIEYAVAWGPDAVLMDVCMSGVDGLQATRLIKAARPGITIIVVSMNGDFEEQALEAGADAFVNKGEPPNRLLQLLDQVADKEGESNQ